MVPDGVGPAIQVSAMLNILIKEHGIDSEIMIGEVFCDGYRFDHS